MKRLFVVRLEAKQHAFCIERQVGPPEAAVQRCLRHQPPHLAIQRQAIDHDQLPARHRHITEPVAGLVLPLGTGRKRHIDQQELGEIDHRIAQHQPAPDASHCQIQLAGFLCGERWFRHFRRHFGQSFGGQSQARRQGLGAGDFTRQIGGVRDLSQPVAFNRRAGFLRRKRAHCGSGWRHIRRDRFRRWTLGRLRPLGRHGV